MRRDQAIVVEGILRDFPLINRDMQDRKMWLEVISVSPGNSGEPIVDGGGNDFVQDRYIKALDDKYYRKLQNIVDTVYSSYCSLTEVERRVIALSCWEEMDNSSIGAEIDASYRYVQRLKAAAFAKMKKSCMDIYSDVEVWRDREHTELSRAISLLCSA